MGIVAPQKFIRHYTGNRLLEAIQDSMVRTTNGVVDNPLVREFEIIEDQALTTGTTLVEHKLDNPSGNPVRWFVIDNNTAATFRRDTASTADLKRFLPLIASAAATVSLYVFVP